MVELSTLPYAVLGIFSSISILRVIKDKKSMLGTIFFNILFGGIVYSILNIFKVDLPFNFISASCIGVLGAPGVILLVVLKTILRIF